MFIFVKLKYFFCIICCIKIQKMNTQISIYELLHTSCAGKYDVKALIQKLDANSFYLGGQIKMNKNDIINAELIQKSKDITKQRLEEYGGPCNSWEAISVARTETELKLIEDIFRDYLLLRSR